MSTNSKPAPQTAPGVSPYLTTPTAANLENLTDLSTLLHLLHHRNKNQHRLASWYRHFGTFRRHLSRLLTHYTTLLAVPETHAARHRKKTQDVTTRAKITAELDFWTEAMVAKWCRAFGQLAADLRFGVLGIFLLAVVGEVAGVTGVTTVLEERGEREVVEAIKRFGREFEIGDEGAADGNGMQRRRIEEDVGEVVVRDSLRRNVDENQGEAVVRERVTDPERIVTGEADERDTVDLVESNRLMSVPLEDDERVPAVTKKRPRPAEPVKSTDEQVKKKKKRRRNAIDELFGSL